MAWSSGLRSSDDRIDVRTSHRGDHHDQIWLEFLGEKFD